jgi:hypothetical protein
MYGTVSPSSVVVVAMLDGSAPVGPFGSGANPPAVVRY